MNFHCACRAVALAREALSLRHRRRHLPIAQFLFSFLSFRRPWLCCMTAQVKQVYYPEMEGLVKEATGAPNVIVFDHTVRESGLANLNNLGAMGMAAASVVRVHCDYTEESAPRRVKQLAESKSYTGVQLDLQQVQKILEGRFSFVNVWRNICDDSPVLTKPLAICDTNTVSRDDHILYQLAYEHRTGYTYSLPYSSEHRWYYYPKMSKDECLIFKDAPPRQSIEARAIAIWDDGPAKPVFYDMVQSNNAARVGRMLVRPDIRATGCMRTEGEKFRDDA
mmetsp:Transcript_734/g.2219  ORF Transcript_734/g.2219 Transcript_734/m.2219 type:complete len:279 (+) Transcript_734:796-1632(+)